MHYCTCSKREPTTRVTHDPTCQCLVGGVAAPAPHPGPIREHVTVEGGTVRTPAHQSELTEGLELMETHGRSECEGFGEEGGEK